MNNYPADAVDPDCLIQFFGKNERSVFNRGPKFLFITIEESNEFHDVFGFE